MRSAPSLLVLAGLTAVVALPAPASARPALVRAPLVHCTTGLEASQRALTVRPKMHAIPGTVRMGIRVALQQRTPLTGRFVHVPGVDGFDIWLKSEKGVTPYDRFQTVAALAAPASYRMRVGFRWYGKRGHVLRTVSRLTRACVEPDLRPNLIVKNIIGTPPQKAGRPWHYVVVVRNKGRSLAGPFVVSFAGGGAVPVAPLSQSLTGLAANTQTRLTFAGPACAAAAPPSATVDSANQVDEADETDDRALAVC